MDRLLQSRKVPLVVQQTYAVASVEQRQVRTSLDLRHLVEVPAVDLQKTDHLPSNFNSGPRPAKLTRRDILYAERTGSIDRTISLSDKCELTKELFGNAMKL